MTYNTYETSLAQGEPILLFDFVVGILHFRYTSADRPITYQTNVYNPAAISRSSPKQTQEVRQYTMTVTAGRDIDVAQIWSVYPPSTDVTLTCTQLHYTDPDAQGIVDWVGRVIGCLWKGSSIEMKCEPVYTSVQTTGLRRRWGLTCPHALYGPACTLAALPWASAGHISLVTGLTIYVSDFVARGGMTYAGGYVEWDSGQGYIERRTIESASGDAFTLQYVSPALVAGLAVTIYPGCARNLAACAAFGNNLNFGGQPNIPNVNPMDGTLINPVF